MEPTIVVERDCSALGGLFQIIVNDMKGGTQQWEDFTAKATKFHTQLKATIIASTAFLDAFQKIADMATSTRGGTKDIGTALTRLCLRHRSVEARLKTFTSSIMDCLILPLSDRLEEWKKITGQLDKDHAKEFKRLRSELKKRHLDTSNSLSVSTSNTLRFKKQAFKNLQVMSKSMDSVEGNEKLFMFEEMEKKAVRRALTEERSRFCLFVNFLRPVVEEELHMLQEVTHLQEILDSLCKLTADPYALPSSSELVISDLKLSSNDAAAWTFQTPPSSPSSFGSRKSSMCSISSFNSSSSGSTHSPSHHCRYRSLSQPCVGPVFRHTSISSQDSGFMSQDYNLLHYAPLPLCPNNYQNQFKNYEVSSLSEQSSGSTSSASSMPVASIPWPEGNLRPHTIGSAYEKNRPHLSAQTYESPLTKDSNYASGDTNTSEESLVCVIPNDGNQIDGECTPPTPTEKPQLPLRDGTTDKPILPQKPDLFKTCLSGADVSYAHEAQPIYANSSDVYNDDTNIAYSEGSITPTNPERSASPNSEPFTLNKSNSSIYSSTSTITQRPNKPPPLPPVRRTSTLSNPNAITMGTLKSVGVSTYEEIQNLTRNANYVTYDDISVLSANSNSDSTNLENQQQSYSNKYSNNSRIYGQTQNNASTNAAPNYNAYHQRPEYEAAKNVFEHKNSHLMQNCHLTDGVMPLPAPPPEAFSDTEITHGHYNKITNVHRQFLETLNSKLSISPSQRMSPRITKRRSMSLTHSDEDWNSDSAISDRPNVQPHSFQQTLKMLVTGSHSRSSSGSTSSPRYRHQSPDTTRKKAAFTLASCDRESLMASLNMKLAQRQQSEVAKEVAKEAAATALQRKQSVPDLKDSNDVPQKQHFVVNSSTANSSLYAQTQQIYQPAVQLQMRFQNLDLTKPVQHTQNAPHQIYHHPVQQMQNQQQQQQQQIYGPVSHQQQQIYGPVLHQQQLQKRSSQPTMGIKITTSRQLSSPQQLYENTNDKTGFMASLKPKLVNKSGQLTHRYSNDYAFNSNKNNQSQSLMMHPEMAIKTSNSPITGQQLATHESFESAVAARVNSWFNSVQLPPELMLCRESLMDQIRRGKQLKRVSSSNDRSAPKIS